MDQVKRYEAVYCQIEESLDLVEYDEGPLVFFRDYAALQQKLDAVLAENLNMRKAIDQTIGWQESVDTENTESVRLLVDLKTPATEDIANELRAEGVECLAEFAGEEYQRFAGDKATQRKWKGVTLLCCDFAAQLRAGSIEGGV